MVALLWWPSYGGPVVHSSFYPPASILKHKLEPHEERNRRIETRNVGGEKWSRIEAGG